MWIVSGENQTLQSIRFGEDLIWNPLALHSKRIGETVDDLHNLSMDEWIIPTLPDVALKCLNEFLEFLSRVQSPIV